VEIVDAIEGARMCMALGGNVGNSAALAFNMGSDRSERERGRRTADQNVFCWWLWWWWR
jgi:hypothetical protein